MGDWDERVLDGCPFLVRTSCVSAVSRPGLTRGNLAWSLAVWLRAGALRQRGRDCTSGPGCRLGVVFWRREGRGGGFNVAAKCSLDAHRVRSLYDVNGVIRWRSLCGAWRIEPHGCADSPGDHRLDRPAGALEPSAAASVALGPLNFLRYSLCHEPPFQLFSAASRRACGAVASVVALGLDFSP